MERIDPVHAIKTIGATVTGIATGVSGALLVLTFVSGALLVLTFIMNLNKRSRINLLLHRAHALKMLIDIGEYDISELPIFQRRLATYLCEMGRDTMNSLELAVENETFSSKDQVKLLYIREQVVKAHNYCVKQEKMGSDKI